MIENGALAMAQKLTSAIPGAVAFKRQLHNNVTACGFTYRFSTPSNGSSFTMLMYHRLFDSQSELFYYGVKREMFESQLAMLKRNAAVLSLDEILAHLDDGRALPRRTVALTFDDGYCDMLTVALPLLKRYGIPAILYVAIEAIERGFLWPDLLLFALREAKAYRIVLDSLADEPRGFSLTSEVEKLRALRNLEKRLKKLPDDEKWRVLDELVHKTLGMRTDQVRIPNLMLSRDELKQLSSEGLTIGAHTVSHPILTRVSAEQAKNEIIQSRKILQEKLGIPVDHFCYPNGSAEDFSPAIERYVEAAGFKSACSTIPGVNDSTTNRFSLKRIDAVQSSLRKLVRVMTEASIGTNGKCL